MLLNSRSSLIVGLVCAGVLGASLTYSIGRAFDAPPSSLLHPEAQAQIQHATNLSKAFRLVAKTVQPSVVSVSSVKKMKMTSAPQMSPQIPEEFRNFFGDDLFRRFESPQRSPRSFEQKGMGTGFIVSHDGYILTNNHVVADADEVTVTLHDDRQFTAKVVGTDPKSDVAVLKIEADNLVPSRLGNSDDLQVGDWVLAVGSPFGLTQSVTSGIVSATGRANVGITDYEDFIQTDAAINPGNSGGPLVNMNGEVVGINTAIATRSGGYNGIGFAIPSNMVISIKDAIMANGRVDRGQLGAIIQNLTPELAQSFGFTGQDGVLISDVVEGSAAHKAGLQTGDIVLRFNGKKMTDLHVLRNTVAATAPGREVDMEIFRNGRTKTVIVAIGRLEDDEATVAEKSSDELGLNLQTLDAELAEQLGYSINTRGVVVTEVEPGSLAARAGLRPKDVIESVNGQKVTNLKTFNEVIEKEDLNNGVRLQVASGKFRRFVFIRGRS